MNADKHRYKTCCLRTINLCALCDFTVINFWCRQRFAYASLRRCLRRSDVILFAWGRERQAVHKNISVYLR